MLTFSGHESIRNKKERDTYEIKYISLLPDEKLSDLIERRLTKKSKTSTTYDQQKIKETVEDIKDMLKDQIKAIPPGIAIIENTRKRPASANELTTSKKRKGLAGDSICYVHIFLSVQNLFIC